MARNPRWRQWIVFSGMTRGEQWALLFLIALMGLGLIYQEVRDERHDESLALHRGELKAATSPAPLGTATSKTLQTFLDINQATAQDLESLPGIGPSLAGAIVQYRAQRGAFRHLEDVQNVPGIGEKTFAAVRPYLAPLAGPTPNPTPLAIVATPDVAPETSEEAIVNLNTADLEALCTLKGVGPVLGQRIIDHRRMNGPFRRVADLDKVSGIGAKILRDNYARMTVGGPNRR